MTSDITDRIQDIGSRTVNIAPYIEGLRPPLRRPDADASGEFQIITGTRPAGADELARLAEGATLVLPSVAAPPTLRPAAQTVVVSESLREKHYRGRHRAAWSPWRLALAGAAVLLAVELVGLAASAVVR